MSMLNCLPRPLDPATLVRPEFHVFTGNDLAIDIVRYGSDWLLGLSTGDSPRRPESDRAIIATILERIDRASQASA